MIGKAMTVRGVLSASLCAGFGALSLVAQANWAKPSVTAAQSGRGGLSGFVENLGQWGEEPKFYAAMQGMDVWLTSHSIKYDFYRLKEGRDLSQSPGKKVRQSLRSGQTVELQFLGSRPNALSQGIRELGGVMNFIRKNQDVSGVRHFDESKIVGLYPGVDLRMYADNGRPRFDLIIAPGTDPSVIRFKYDGTGSVRLVDSDTIAFGTRYGEMNLADLKAYQQGDVEAVRCAFVKNSDGTFGFKVGSYDANRPLVIDPVVFSTLYGGFAPAFTSLGFDEGFGVAVDSLNAAYTTGYSNCPNFPITNGVYDNTISGIDAYVAKFTADGSNLVYTTYVGGPGTDAAFGIAVDSQFRPIIAGQTDSPGSTFPTIPGAPQEVYGGGTTDGFVVRLNSNGGALNFGTYLGGSSPPLPIPPPGDVINSISIGPSDAIFVGGQAVMPDFPTTGGVLQSIFGGSTTDGFVAKISSSGALSYCTFLGGTGGENVRGIVVNGSGEAHVTGSTSSTNFPLTAGSFDTDVQQTDAYVCRINSTGTALIFGTVVGGSSNDAAVAIALDSQGSSYIVGSTTSVDFPRTAGCYDDNYNPDFENFVTKVGVDGKNLIYSTFLNSAYNPTGIGVDDTGVAHIIGFGAGISTSANSDDASYNGPPLYQYGDCLVQALDEAGSSLLYGSYYGGFADEGAFGIVVDRSRNAFVVGSTNSYFDGTTVPFPTTPGSFKQFMANDNPPTGPAFFDAFLMKLKVRSTPVIATYTITPTALAGTETATATITLSGPASPGGAVIRLASTNEAIAQPQDGSGNLIDQIVIPEGGTTATFPVATFDVTSSQTVTVSAELEGDTKKVNLTVAPWLTNLTLSPNTVVGGNRVTGRITLFRPALAGMEVSVNTSDATKAYAVDAAGTQIASFTVPTGNTTATFDVLTRGVNTTANVTILTKIITPNLQVTRSQVLQVRPAALRSLTFTPNRVDGGASTIGVVLLDGEAGPSPVKVDLTQGTTGTPPVSCTFPPYVYIRKDATDVNKGKQISFTITAGIPTANTFRNIVATRNNTNPIQTKQATLFVDFLEMASVDLSSTSVTGGSTVTGHVTLSKPAGTGGFTCTVATSDVVYAPFSGNKSSITVNIPAGAIRNSPDFSILTKMTTTTKTATFTASKTGFASKTATLTIRPLNFSLSFAPNPVVGGSRNVTATVTLTDVAPSPSGARVYLTNSDTSACTVPGSVLVPAGANSATFTITTKSVVVPKVATVTGTLNTLPTATVHSANLTVNPLLIGISVIPTSIVGGNTAIGTVSLSDIAGPAGLLVTLSSSTTNAVVPSSIRVPAGALNMNFNVVTKEVLNTETATITGRTASGVSASDTLVIVPFSISLSLNPTTVIGGAQNSAGSVTISAPATRNLTVTYTSSNTAAAVTSPSSNAITKGNTTQSVTIVSKPVTANVNVTITARLQTGATATAVLRVNAPSVLDLTLAASEIVGGDSTTGTVRITSPAPGTGAVIAMTSSNANVQVPATVTVLGGRTSATFNVTSNPVASDLNVTITASFNGTSASATLSVLAPTLLGLSFAPTTITGGNSTTGRVSIDRPAPAGGIRITLTKSAGSAGSPYVNVPASVTIPAGATFVTFTVTSTTVSRVVACNVIATFGPRSQQAVGTITLLPR